MGPKMCKSSTKLTTPSFLGGFEILEGINDHPRCWGNCLVKSRRTIIIIPSGGYLNVAALCFFHFCGSFIVWRFAMDFMCFGQFASQLHWFYGFSARWQSNMDILFPEKVFLFWWVISQSDSGAMVLACESGYGYLFCARC